MASWPSKRLVGKQVMKAQVELFRAFLIPCPHCGDRFAYKQATRRKLRPQLLFILQEDRESP